MSQRTLSILQHGRRSIMHGGEVTKAILETALVECQEIGLLPHNKSGNLKNISSTLVGLPISRQPVESKLSAELKVASHGQLNSRSPAEFSNVSSL
jgi:hypothetical protein